MSAPSGGVIDPAMRRPKHSVLVDLGPKAMKLLRQLHRQGLHGVTIESVAETLILEGLRARADLRGLRIR